MPTGLVSLLLLFLFLKVPKGTESVHTLLSTPLHHLIVALAVTRDEDDFRAEPFPRIS